MTFFDIIKERFFPPRSNSADAAKNRLKMVLAVERSENGPDFLPLLQRELIEVIRKYVDVDQDKVKVDIERGIGMSVLEVNVELPTGERVTV